MKLKLKVVDLETNKIYEVKAIDFLHECVYISTDNNEHWQDKLENYEILVNTGVKDKQGNEIYEGDIVQYDIKNGSKENQYSYIKYFNGSFGLFHLDFHPLSELDNFEIKGNTWTNPELLSGAVA